MNEIQHSGVITSISGNNVIVLLKDNFNCLGCQLQSACISHSLKSKEFTFSVKKQSYKLGEEVLLIIQQNLVMKAVFFAYVIPFIILISILILSVDKIPEWLAGILTIVFIFIYFLFLKFKDKKFDRVFKIEIKKTSI